MRLAAALAILLAALLAGLYASLPYWLGPAARALAPADYDIELGASSLAPWRLAIDRLVIADRGQGWRLTLRPVVVRWRPATGVTVEISAARLDLRELRLAGGEVSGASNLTSAWLPFDGLRIAALDILPPGGLVDGTVSGRLEVHQQDLHLALTTPWRGASLALDANLTPTSAILALRHSGLLVARARAALGGNAASVPFAAEVDPSWLGRLLDADIGGQARVHGTLRGASDVRIDLEPGSVLELALGSADLSVPLAGTWQFRQGALQAPGLPARLTFPGGSMDARIAHLSVAGTGLRARIEAKSYTLAAAPELAERAAALGAGLGIAASRDSIVLTLDSDSGAAAEVRMEMAPTNGYAIDARVVGGILPRLLGEPIDGSATIRGELRLTEAAQFAADGTSRVRIHAPGVNADMSLAGCWTFAHGQLSAPPITVDLESAATGSLDVEISGAVIDRESAIARFVARGAQGPTATLTARGEVAYDIAGHRLQLAAGSMASGRLGLPDVDAGEITLRLLDPLIWTHTEPMRGRIELVSGPLRVPSLIRRPLGRFDYRAELEIDPHGYTTRLRGSLGVAALRAQADAVIEPGAGTWRITLQSAPGATLGAAPVVTLVTELEPALDSLGGSLALRGTLSGHLDGRPPILDVTLDARDVSFRYAQTRGFAEQLQTRVHGPIDALTLGATEIRAGRWETSTPLRDVHAHIGGFAITEPVADIHASLTTLGGRAVFACPAFDLSTASGRCKAEVRGMELEQIVALEDQAAVKASGKVTGEFELGLEAGVPTAQGELHADGRGFLAYRADPGLRQGADEAGLGLALAALDNFSYSDLGAELRLDESGRLTLKARLTGHNPDVEGGREIRFNLKVDNEGFWQALQITLGIADNFERTLKEQL